MGLVFHGCERVGEREGLCATAARGRKGDRADGKGTGPGTVRLGCANGWLKGTYKPLSWESRPVVPTFWRLARRTARLIQEHVRAKGQIYQGETIKASQLGSAQDNRTVQEGSQSAMAGEQ